MEERLHSAMPEATPGRHYAACADAGASQGSAAGDGVTELAAGERSANRLSSC